MELVRTTIVRYSLFLLFGVILGLTCHSTLAWGGLLFDERTIKAAYLYKFLLVTQWPSGSLPTSKDDIVICLVRSSTTIPMEKFSSVRETRINRRSVKIIYISQEFSSSTSLPCSMIFVSTEKISVIIKMLDTVKGRPILTVSDSKGFLELGGMIKLSVREGRMVYAISQGTVEKMGLRLPSHVYQLAEVLYP